MSATVHPGVHTDERIHYMTSYVVFAKMMK